MADIESLRLAIQSMFPDETYPRFVQVPKGAQVPWSHVSISLPAPNGRAMNKRVLSFRVPIRVRVVCGNDLAVWQVGASVASALEGRRVECDGWQCSPIEQLNDEPIPYEDRDVTLTGTNAHPVILPLDFDFYATTKETP